MKKERKAKFKMLASQYRALLREGFFRGLGWAVGVTVGFSFVSVVVVAVLSKFVTFPVVGDFFATIVEETQRALQSR